MNFLPFLISIIVILFTATALFRKLNPQGVLILSGLLMLVVAQLLDIHPVSPTKPTGDTSFDFIRIIEETFISNIAHIGMMIMTIGGYVSLMNHIHATDALVNVSMKPLSSLRRYPYIAATATIIIGQVLFMTIPSAVGIGLLLVASAYPILISIGVSKLTALSVIAAATIFDQGPGSANTALAAQLIGQSNVEYFITHQLPLVIPTTIVVMILFYFNNRYFDKKESQEHTVESIIQFKEQPKCDVPYIFALLPVLPLLILVICSPYLGILSKTINLNTTTAMLTSLFVSLIFVIIVNRNIHKTFEAFVSFWKGMGNVFSNVVTLIIASEIFAKGLISLSFTDSLVSLSSLLGLSGFIIAIVFIILIYSAAILMGSGNAAFFSFGPLLPNIALQLHLPVYALVLPMQLASSMGRASSPISGIIVAIAGVAGISSIDLAKRNAIPLAGGVVFLMFYHFIIL
jgi:DcuC family C4-dicarboxylate transporter